MTPGVATTISSALLHMLMPCVCSRPLFGQWWDVKYKRWQPKCELCNRQFRITEVPRSKARKPIKGTKANG